ncbi:hypothetical protein JKP88DRAFT_243817 [Tribonema minus]|uniref:Uncharacterized protein n=1 Tax=Tribonema minus TaxID=303371 RepID=A0A836CL28_9STRA|nr:hypothetical protein JKP88DRAFT_243817 [Tribonema minus]
MRTTRSLANRVQNEAIEAGREYQAMKAASHRTSTEIAIAVGRTASINDHLVDVDAGAASANKIVDALQQRLSQVQQEVKQVQARIEAFTKDRRLCRSWWAPIRLDCVIRHLDDKVKGKAKRAETELHRLQTEVGDRKADLLQESATLRGLQERSIDQHRQLDQTCSDIATLEQSLKDISEDLLQCFDWVTRLQRLMLSIDGILANTDEPRAVATRSWHLVHDTLDRPSPLAAEAVTLTLRLLWLHCLEECLPSTVDVHGEQFVALYAAASDGAVSPLALSQANDIHVQA